ncbi:hypothetical protein [Streptomyces showdoensis]|uniref:hypothetical protein n=1 Tax=Streptomyces showdoensis TaxID=68268 RepID=UPI000F4E91A6|nr:hypothetical protein [Streptomyces showdoensis]
MFAAATVLALTMGGGLTPLAGTAAAEPVPEETVIPAPYYGEPLYSWTYKAEQARLWQADSTGSEGVFRYEAGHTRDILWTRYSDGKTLTVPLPTVPWTEVQGTGTDTLAFIRDGEVELRDPQGGARVHPLPPGYFSPRVFGSTLLAFTSVTQPDGTRTAQKHLLSLQDDGTTRELEIGGLPEGTRLGSVSAADATSLLFTAQDEDGTRRQVLVSRETGTVETVTKALPAGYTFGKLSPEYIVAYSSDPAVHTAVVASRTDPAAPLVDVPVDTTITGPLHHLAVVGDWLVYRDSQSRVESVPIAGGATVDLLTHITGTLSSGPAGTAVAVGTTGAGGDRRADWGVHRITADPTGRPVVTTVKRFHEPGHIRGIALAKGELSTADDRNPAGTYAWERPVSSTVPLTYGGVSDTYGSAQPACTGDGDLPCAQLRALGDGRFLRWAGADGTNDRYTGANVSVTVPKGGRLVDANPLYVVRSGPGAVGRQTTTALYGGRILDERAPGAAALWGSWLWTAGTSKGVVTAKDLETARTVETVDTGASCVPAELQAAGRRLYWSCGPDGPAGIYDRATKTSRPVPAGEALIGDGYVVTHDRAAGKLVLTGADPTGPAGRVVGDLPDTGVSQRHVRWTVDKFGGHIAYVDARDQVHLVPSGIEAPPLSLLENEGGSTVVDAQKGTDSLSSVLFSKPVGTWTLTARHRVSGTVSRLSSGKDVRGRLWLPWHGYDEAGNLLPSGAYTWTLTAEPADGVGPGIPLSGEATLVNGTGQATGKFHPIPAQRAMDTRTGLGVRKGKVGAKGTVTLKIGDRWAVPTHELTAVTVNVTAVNATAATYVSVYPAGTTRGSASNVNVRAGSTTANLVTVPVKDGKITLYNHAGSVDLVADISGYFTTTGTSDHFEPLKPTRVLDTRTGLGSRPHKADDYHWPTVQVTGRSGIPATGVTAVLVNLTATNATRRTDVTAYVEQSEGSILNLGVGETVSNLAVVPVSPNGTITFVNRAGAADLIADIAGYYTGTHLGSLFQPLAPARSLDTRTGTGTPKGKVGAGRTVTLTVAGLNGVPASGATAVVLNLTATGGTRGTVVTAYSYGTNRPGTSNLNVPAGRTVSVLAVVPVKDGKVTLYNHSGSVDLIADVQGFYAP